MQELVQKFRAHVIELSNTNEKFVHRRWFVKYHLEIVEKIALELCAKFYPQVDKDFITLLVWLHDYGKIIDFANQYETTLRAGSQKLLELGFEPDVVKKAVEYIEFLDKKENIASPTTPLEIKIVSSADGASHLIGPFFDLWWHENAHKPFEELMADNVRKLEKDWGKKIVLPEVIKAFSARRDLQREQCGEIPKNFFE
jgi:hypothetical protein